MPLFNNQINLNEYTISTYEVLSSGLQPNYLVLSVCLKNMTYLKYFVPKNMGLVDCGQMPTLSLPLKGCGKEGLWVEMKTGTWEKFDMEKNIYHQLKKMVRR